MFLIALLIISQFFIFSTFTMIEQNSATTDIQRVLSRFDGEIEDVATKCQYWAIRNDTYTFVTAGDPPYISENFPQPVFFRNMKINYVLIYNAKGTLIWSAGFNTTDGTPVAVPQQLSAIVQNSIIPEGSQEGISGRRGFSILNSQPIILAGYTIAPPDHEPPAGTLIMVRIIDPAEIASLAQQTDLDISIKPEAGNPIVPTFSTLDKKRLENGAIIVRPVNDTVIEGITSITGIENSPTHLIVTVDTPRTIFEQVRASVIYIAAVVIVFIIILILAILWPLRRYIVKPILTLDTRMKEIGESGNTAQQVAVAGDAEIVSLAGSLNRMLAEIDNAHHQTVESEAKFRALTENTPDILFSVDKEGVITYISPQVGKYGSRPGDLVGKRASSFVHPEDRATVDDSFKSAVQTCSGIGTSFRSLDKRNNLSWFEMNATPILDKEGNCIGFYGILRDITERRKALDAITLAHKKLNLMYEITRHDILNKIAILFGLVDMTKASSLPEERNGLLEEIRDTGNVIYHQIALTRDYQSVGINEPRWISLTDAISTTIKKFSGTGVKFVADLEQYEIYADPMFEKVIYNLVDNAIRYGEKLTTITFSSRRTTTGIEFICEDDGVGIDADLKERIFERGFGKNTGLGLFLCREILAITGIRIDETGEPQKGARFVLSFPRGTYRKAEP